MLQGFWCQHRFRWFISALLKICSKHTWGYVRYFHTQACSPTCTGTHAQTKDERIYNPHKARQSLCYPTFRKKTAELCSAQLHFQLPKINPHVVSILCFQLKVGNWYTKEWWDRNKYKSGQMNIAKKSRHLRFSKPGDKHFKCDKQNKPYHSTIQPFHSSSRKRPPRSQCHDVCRHTSFGSTAPECHLNWHTGAAWHTSYLVQCEQTQVENWRAFTSPIMQSLCVKRNSVNPLHTVSPCLQTWRMCSAPVWCPSAKSGWTVNRCPCWLSPMTGGADKLHELTS